MKQQAIILVIVCLFICLSCVNRDPNKQVEEGIVTNETYYSEAMGWKIEIPAGWEVMNKDVTDKMQERGLKELGDYVDEDYDLSELKSLISFQKNRFTNLQSTIEPFDEEVHGSWEENNRIIKSIIYETFVTRGMNVDTSATVEEKIDGIPFKHYNITLKDANGNIILHQAIFGAHRKGHDFGININYREEEDGEILLATWRNSTFRK